MDLSPDIREVVRYLGYHGVAPDPEVMREINDCVRDLQKEVTPRFVYERFPLSVKTEPDAAPLICLADIQVRSRNLAKNLEKCCGAYLMAVTLGPGPDRLIKRASVSSMSRAVIYQEAAAAMTEEWSLLMTPSKSVTALIGVSKEPGECRRKGCEECEAADNCAYRA